MKYSPYSKTSYYTKFTVMSGKFNRNYEDFHPSAIDTGDEGVFGGFPDICHNVRQCKAMAVPCALMGLGIITRTTLALMDGDLIM